MRSEVSTQFFIGTSGWHYLDWPGKFYPKDVKGYKELSYFAEKFNTVEINSIFYSIPKAETVEKWYAFTPNEFVFSLKLNKMITHHHQLSLNDISQVSLNTFIDRAQLLKNKLGAILIQLPASLKYDPKKLDLFLKVYKQAWEKKVYKPDHAIEFRHPYWFTSDTYSILKNHNVAFTIAQSSKYPLEQVITADVGYFRFHGPQQLFFSKYSSIQMQEWAASISKLQKDLKKVYIYFNNTGHAYAIENAIEIRSLLSQ